MVAAQARAIADGTVIGPVAGKVALLAQNVATLKTWTQEVHQ